MKSIINFFKQGGISKSFKTRQVKYGGFASIITLAVIAGLIMLNLAIERFSPQVDLTSNKLFSLSDQTLQLLDSIKKPVKFYGLWRPGEENQDVITVINLYLAKNKNISLELKDPDRNPGFLVRYDKENKGITRGSLIVEGEKGFRVISPNDMYDFNQSRSGGWSISGVAVEQRITSALLFAGTGSTPIVYEITGHGELPLSSFGFQEVLTRENLQLKAVNLLTAPVPSDASVLVLNNPRRDLASQEVEKLLEYLRGGGRLIILADYTIKETGNLNDLLASYGLKFEYGIVRETDPYYVAIDPRTEWPDMAEHEITKPLADKSRTPVVLLEAMALSIQETRRRSLDVVPLMTSSSSAFLRTDLNNTSESKSPKDISGPLILGAAVKDPSRIEGNESQARIVVIGAGTLLPLASQGFDANKDLFMNSLTWLQDRPENISLRSKSLYLLPMKLRLAEIVLLGAIFILIIPASFFIGGLVTWLKRRHL